ncbi:MAG: spore coat U domain-containing protein [Gammaproteobacteria bacterium]|nr:spore coat U domain-containing protein [Gammaproteobacteria bacterium]
MTETNDKCGEPTTRVAGAFIFVMILLFMGEPAWAARNCTLTVTSISFGTYTPGQTAPVNANGNVHVRCRGKPRAAQPPFYLLGLSAGNSGSFNPRRMQKSPGNILTYNVYLDPLHTTIWGDGSPGTSLIQQPFACGGCPGNSNKYDADHPAYGQTDAAQDPEPGYYSDNLIVTLIF